jgi:hypothetical protein
LAIAGAAARVATARAAGIRGCTLYADDAAIAAAAMRRRRYIILWAVGVARRNVVRRLLG